MIEEGNIYWYPKGRSHCKHGIIYIVKNKDDKLFAIDTYWDSMFKGKLYSDITFYDVSKLNEDDLLFLMKIEDIKEVSEHEYWQYDEEDKFYIPIGGWHPRYIVNKNISKNIEYIKNQLLNEIKSAEYRIKSSQQEIEEKKKQLTELG